VLIDEWGNDGDGHTALTGIKHGFYLLVLPSNKPTYQPHKPVVHVHNLWPGTTHNMQWPWEQEIWANAHETCKSLWQFLFTANIGLSLSSSSHFTLLQPKIAKCHKNTLFSTSCKIIDVDTINKHITIACYDNIAKFCQKTRSFNAILL